MQGFLSNIKSTEWVLAIYCGVLLFLVLIAWVRFVLLFRQKNQKHLSSAKPVHFLYLKISLQKQSTLNARQVADDIVTYRIKPQT